MVELLEYLREWGFRYPNKGDLIVGRRLLMLRCHLLNQIDPDESPEGNGGLPVAFANPPITGGKTVHLCSVGAEDERFDVPVEDFVTGTWEQGIFVLFKKPD